MQDKFIIANWKLHGSLGFIDKYFSRLIEHTQNLQDALSVNKFIICPPAIYLNFFQNYNYDGLNKILYLGAQNCSDQLEGAYTGEISAASLPEFSCKYVIIGHSERRTIYKETDQMVNHKLKNAISYNVNPILCIGESLEERKSGKTYEVLFKQIELALKDIEAQLPSGVDSSSRCKLAHEEQGLGTYGAQDRSVFNIHEDPSTGVTTQLPSGVEFIIAYEPIWAIGTGLTPTIDEINETHAQIKEFIINKCKFIAKNCKIIYGGSVKASNAEEILNLEYVDGLLIGGASLKIDEMVEILKYLD